MADPDSVEIQPPTLEAAQIMFDIACNSDAVDTYPEYFYLTMYRDFAATSLIAQEQSRPIAYAIAYAKHEDPGVLFIWQIAAVTKSRSRGIARRLIRALIDNRGKSLRFIEVTSVESGDTYVVFEGERHELFAKTDLRGICCFTPPTRGDEVHDANGSYPL